MATEPRIATPGGRDGDGLTSISITPYQMSPGDEKIVAARIHATLSNPPAQDPPATAVAPVADVSGRWTVHIDYVAGASTHTLHLRQTYGRVEGTHQGDFVSRDLTGTIDGNRVQFSSNYTERNGDALSFRFTGNITGEEMAGALDMGEYLTGKWRATRYRRG